MKKSARFCLARIALARTHERKKVKYSGPVFEFMLTESGAARLKFAHIGSGLVAYAWADNPEGAKLYNAAGLPAPSFRIEK